MQTLILPAEKPAAIESAVALLREGEIIAFPTDTVYGLGSDAFYAPGIIKLFEAKGRDSNKAMSILIGELDQAELITDHMTKCAKKLIAKFWPGGSDGDRPPKKQPARIDLHHKECRHPHARSPGGIGTAAHIWTPRHNFRQPFRWQQSAIRD